MRPIHFFVAALVLPALAMLVIGVGSGMETLREERCLEICGQRGVKQVGGYVGCECVPPERPCATCVEVP